MLTRAENKAGLVVLGIDPGTATTGFGAVGLDRGKLKPLEFGIVATPAKTAPSVRLKLLHQQLSELIGRWKPTEIAVEKLFFAKNARTALAVGEARGVVLLAAAQSDCAVAEYTPLQVKQAVVGYGKADKSQVQFMVQALLSLKEKPRPDDAADALAIAVCHMHSRNLLSQLARGASGRERSVFR